MISRDPTIQDIDWFNDLLAFKRLELNPPYQRYSVWSKSYQQYFIDTIINNFPSPAIFLHKEKLPENKHLYHVVDGKQRLLAIFGFQKGEFSLPKDHDLYPAAYYDDLPAKVHSDFGNYKIQVEILGTKSIADLREAFDRLNRNVRKLNKQELRHARHDGPLIKMLETLSEHPFWTEIGIRTPARIRSMRDVEFVSEIFQLSMQGIQDSSYKVLDVFYANYDDEEDFEEIEKHRSSYEGCLSIMERLDGTFFQTTRYGNLNDFYSLWATFLKYADRPEAIEYNATRSQLSAFSGRIVSPDDIPLEDSIALKYSDAVRQGANKMGNRRIRSEILAGCIIEK